MGPLIFPNLGVSLSSNATPTGSWCRGRCAGDYQHWQNFSFEVSDFCNSSVHGPWTLTHPSFTAVISMAKGIGRFVLAFESKTQDVPQLTFPLLNGTRMDQEPDMVALFPVLGGIFVKAGEACYGDCVDPFVMDYPGSMHSPYAMLCTRKTCLMAAATTWPPMRVRPKRRMRKGQPTAQEPMQIDWVDGFLSAEKVNITILLSEFSTNESSQTEAWQEAVLAYRSWIKPHVPQAKPQPEVGGKMAHSEGMWAVGLQNICDPPGCSFNLSILDAKWQAWKDVLGRVQVYLLGLVYMTSKHTDLPVNSHIYQYVKCVYIYLTGKWFSSGAR